MKKKVTTTRSSPQNNINIEKINTRINKVNIWIDKLNTWLIIFVLVLIFIGIPVSSMLDKKHLAKGTPDVLPALPYYDSSGVIPHPFSVSPNHKVYFSSGNLLCDTIRHDMYFAPYQVITEKAESTFRWIAHPVATAHIRSGGIVGKDWRELTGAEWNYLLKSRADAKKKIQNARLGLPHGESVYGMFIFPDDWKGRSAGLASESYNYDEWSKMMLDGAVFFPLYELPESKGFGYVWTRTHHKNEDNSISRVYVGYTIHRGRRSSVHADELSTLYLKKTPESCRLGLRLVRDAE